MLRCLASAGWAEVDDVRAYLHRAVLNQARQWVRSAPRRHRPVRVVAVPALMLAGLAVVLIVALVLNQPGGSSRVTVRPGQAAGTHGAGLAGPGPDGFPAPLGPIQDSDASTGQAGDGANAVVVHLVVDADGVTGGEKIHGHLQVIDNTRHGLRTPAVCRADLFAAVIYGGRFPERPVFPASSCARSFTFPVGVTTLPFTVTTSYDSPAGLRPLPTGHYHVGVVVGGPHIPVPAPLPVIVLPSDLNPSRAAVHRLEPGRPFATEADARKAHRFSSANLSPRCRSARRRATCPDRTR